MECCENCRKKTAGCESGCKRKQRELDKIKRERAKKVSHNRKAAARFHAQFG